MTTYTFTIATLERTNDADNGVVTVHWRLDAADGDFTAGAYGTESFTPDPSAEGFVAYADLTPEIVTGWVTEAWGEEKLQQVKDALQAKIDEQKNPATVAGVPWG